VKLLPESVLEAEQTTLPDAVAALVAKCSELEAEVSRLKTGVEVEPLTEVEIVNVYALWETAWGQAGNSASGHADLVIRAAEAQRAKVRPRTELTEAEFNRVHKEWCVTQAPGGETFIQQLMRMLEEARRKKAGTP
jgi:high-affinity K+ transport system ATPase subunit B